VPQSSSYHAPLLVPHDEFALSAGKASSVQVFHTGGMVEVLDMEGQLFYGMLSHHHYCHL